MTREKSKAVQEIENPFADDEDEEANFPTKNTLSPAAAASGRRGSTATASYGESKAQSHSHDRSPSSGSFFGSSSSKKKEKEKEKERKEREKQQQKNVNKVRRPLRLEDHKDEIKVAIADGNIAFSNLMNTVLSMNREQSRVSENEEAVKKFEECEKIRRRVVRYVSRREKYRYIDIYLYIYTYT